MIEESTLWYESEPTSGEEREKRRHNQPILCSRGKRKISFNVCCMVGIVLSAYVSLPISMATGCMREERITICTYCILYQ